MTLEYIVSELAGKTKIIMKNNTRTNILDTLQIWSVIVLFTSLLVGYISSYSTVTIIIAIFIFLVVIEFIFIFYVVLYRKTLTLLIDPINRSFTSNNKFTYVFNPQTKIIQYYQYRKGEKIYGNLVFEIDGEKNIGSLGDGDANYYFGKKLNELLDIPYSSEMNQEYYRKIRKSDYFILVQSISLVLLSLFFFYSFLKL